MGQRGALAIGMMLLAAAGSVAAELSLAGNYGNGAGCAYLKSGNFEDDALRYLTPRKISAYASGCEFVAVHADAAGKQLARGICSHEGEEMLTAEDHIIMPPDASGRIRIYTGTGDIWAELEPCP